MFLSVPIIGPSPKVLENMAPSQSSSPLTPIPCKTPTPVQIGAGKVIASPDSTHPGVKGSELQLCLFQEAKIKQRLLLQVGRRAQALGLVGGKWGRHEGFRGQARRSKLTPASGPD